MSTVCDYGLNHISLFHNMTNLAHYLPIIIFHSHISEQLNKLKRVLR